MVVWCEDFRIDLRDERLWRGQQALPLTPKAFAVLRPHRAAGPAGDEDRAVRRDLARHGGRRCGAHGGDLRAARRALGDDPRAPRFIQTVHRRGYRFVATIRSSPASHVGSIAAGPGPPSDPSLDVTADEPDRAPDVAPSRALVGREEEMRQLHACLRGALDGQCQVVFVPGEPGIGKTALVGAFLEQVARSTPGWTGEGQCIEHYGAGEAYLPVFGGLCVSSAAALRGPGCGRSWVSTPRAGWRRCLASSTHRPWTRSPLRTQGATRERMLREMADALEALTTEQPVVVVLEDLHWSDHASVELLSFLARIRPAARLLLIGTYRPADVVAREHPDAGCESVTQTPLRMEGKNRQ
jgi:hypothetical protein